MASTNDGNWGVQGLASPGWMRRPHAPVPTGMSCTGAAHRFTLPDSVTVTQLALNEMIEGANPSPAAIDSVSVQGVNTEQARLGSRGGAAR